MTRWVDLDSVAALELAKGRMAAGSSVEAASKGDFAPITDRIRAGVELHQIERDFLVGLFEGTSEFVVKRKDGRRRSRRNIEREMAIADYVMGKIHDGLSEAEAFKAADAEFREGNSERLDTIRKAYREWGPIEFDASDCER